MIRRCPSCGAGWNGIPVRCATCGITDHAHCDDGRDGLSSCLPPPLPSFFYSLMRLTKAELEDATGASDLHSLVELSLTNKYIDDLGYLGKLTQLQELSLGAPPAPLSLSLCLSLTRPAALFL